MNPTYVIDKNALCENYNQFSKYGKIYFPVKTNHNPHILKILKGLGSGFECDSVEHIKKVYSRKICEEIIFSNVAKSEEDIVWAINHKLNFYTVDDENTLLKIIELAKKKKFKSLKINVRLNVFDIFKKEFTSQNVQDSRLGASVNTCKKLLAIINNETNIKIIKGISFYVQKEVHDDENFLKIVSEYIVKNFSNLDGLDYINIGGGCPINQLKVKYPLIMKDFEKLGVKTIILEPGRFMVNGVEDLFVRARRIIDCDLNGGEKLITLSVGIYHGLIDKKLHNRKFEFGFVNKNGEFEAFKDYDGVSKKMVLRGPTADSSDLLGVFNLPQEELNINTIFEIKNVGAYVEVLHSDFSGKVKLNYKVKDKN